MNSLSFNLEPGKSVPERRESQRLKIAVQTELRVNGSAPMRACTSDLSLGGCYVEMMFTLAVGKEVEIILWLGQVKVVARARVATCHPQFGNGFQFLGMKADDLDLLETFLAAEAETSPKI